MSRICPTNRTRILELVITLASLPDTATQLTTRTLQQQLQAFVGNDGERSTATKVTLLGRTVMLGADAVPGEHNRRLATALGPITNRPLLSVLFEMPENRFYEWSWFDPAARRELLAAPTGVVERTALGVRRLATYPVGQIAVILDGKDPRSLMLAAGDFAAFAQRWICCPADKNTELELEASLYRIGVIRVDDDGHATETCDPPPFIPARFTPALWRFHEVAYAALLASDAFVVSAPTFLNVQAP